MAGRLSRGWRFAKASLSVVRRDPALVTLSILGVLLACALALVPLVGGAIAIDSNNDGVRYLGYALLVAALFLAYFAIVFIGVAIALAAAKVLDGEDATVGNALGGAVGRIGPIVGWSLVGATVQVLFFFIRGRAGIAGDILAGLGAAAWSLVTFLAVPVVAFEGLGPIATLKRSASLYSERWGEQITGTFSINGIFFLAALPAIGLVVLGIVVGGSGGVALGLLGVVLIAAIMVVARAASATFGVVLYRYVAAGEAVGPFEAEELGSVVSTA